MSRTLIERLQEGLPAEAVLTDPDVTSSYAHDMASFCEAGTPAVVVLPRTVEQVQHVMRTATELRIPVVPQGARTGLSGAANASEGCIVLSLVKMDRILEISPVDRIAVVEPGVVNATLSRAVGEHGLYYPPDPSSWETCTIGGNIGTASGGLCCVKYGVTAEYVLGLDVVLADGRLMSTGRRTAKGVAGYDLTRLFVGSEGSLGIVVRAVLALKPQPPRQLVLAAEFASTKAACDAVCAIMEGGHVPSLLELMDRTTVKAVNALANMGLPESTEGLLLAAFDTADPAADLAAVGALTCADGQATLTPLGSWAVWVKLEQICVAAQSPAGHIEQSAEDMLRGCARLRPNAARAEYRAWLAARTVTSAVTDLLAAARGEDALLRGLAFEALRVVGAPAEAEVRAVVDEVPLRPYALLWLAEQEGTDPEDVHFVLTREESTWLWIDTAAAVADHGEAQILVRHLESAVQPTVPALLDEVRRAGHPRTVQVLVALAAAHPDPALAKAMRRAAFQVHTGGE